MPNNPQFDEIGGGFDEKPTPPPLDKNQKIAAASLAAFAVLIIILWAAQLKNNIYGPFNSSGGAANEPAIADDEAKKIAGQKVKDTDSDGLTDYDELNVYKTSPYLADTDSDGYADGEEIKKGFDPNCPQGRTCAGSSDILANSSQASSTPGATASPQAGLNNLSGQNDVLNSLLNQFNSGQAQSAAGGSALSNDQLNALKNIDAVSLRQLLLQNGMDKATLDKINDQQLLQSFQETLKGQ